ncbi:MAG: FlgO family outer membrane protein [Campylobacterota bacterium]|nr:FlgO family outer membrane protein [Campylobacterota bacterium]
MKLSFYSFLAISFLLVGCENSKLDLPDTNNTIVLESNNTAQASSIVTNDNAINNTPIKYVSNQNIQSTLNNTILDIANQLLLSNTVHNKITSIILTSFVELDSFQNTSSFGNILSESMFNELHIRKFKVTDFRGQDAVSVNENGEFHITRDVDRLKDNIEAIEYILVGTYVPFEDESLLINARIIDSISGEVISVARVIFKPKDCNYYSICNKQDNIIKDIVVSTDTTTESNTTKLDTNSTTTENIDNNKTRSKSDMLLDMINQNESNTNTDQETLEPLMIVEDI